MGATVNSELLANSDSLGVSSIQAVVPKYKRRRVSAIRDYPPGCGRFATPITEIAGMVEDAGNDTAKIMQEGLAVPPVGAFGNENKPQSVDIFINSSPTGMNVLKDGMGVKEAILENDHGSIKNEIVPVVLCEFSDILKQVYVDGMASQQGGAVLPNISQNLILSHDIVAADLEKGRTRRYPPKGRVSAIRDYPPFCGRFASCPQNNEYVEVESSQKNKNLCEQISSSDNKAIGLMVGDEEKMKEENIKQGEACTNELVDGKEKHEEEKNRSKVVMEVEKCVAGVYKRTVEKEARCSDEMNRREKLSKVTGSQHPSQSDFGVMGIASGRKLVPNLMSESEYTSKQREAFRNLADEGEEENKWLMVVTEENDFDSLEDTSDRMIVLGLMAQPICLWSPGKDTHHLAGGSRKKKGKEVGPFVRLEKSKHAAKTKNARNYLELTPFKNTPTANPSVDKMVSCDNDDYDYLLDQEHNDDLQLVHLLGNVEVNGFPPSHGGGVRIDSGNNISNRSRHKVKEALRLFQAVCRKLLHKDEANLKEETGRRKRVDLQAAKLVKSANKYVNKVKKIVGSVPGVEVGDEFQYRVELNMIGLHHQLQGGIDYVKHKGKLLTTSIVASGGYADDLDNSDVLIYTGQGGNVMNADKKPEDQKLERGNLALKNSSEEKNPVRVIRGSESVDGKTKVLVYDGLYVVDRYWQDVGPHGKLVFRFRLHRIPGQPELAWKELKKSKKLIKREGLIMEDISRGKEKNPICALNTIDHEKPPPFNYITRMIYPNWCNPIPPRGCNCTNGCLVSVSCSCTVKNGGEMPYNHNGAIVEAKALVSECGPSCKCPSSCHNRVTQLGIKFQLEIFKTEKMGWGVRSLNSIPSGSFICEYIGELLDDTEAEKRAGSDEYLFDIGKNYTDNSVWDELSSLMPDDTHSSCSKGVENNGFTIDAAHYGNIGRFINHSCSPNLYAQDVLYDHDDSRIPHVMLFAMDNIPPLQELTYHYNYVIDQVHDSQGNIKRKDCYCGSVECAGRMY